jgi:hypothetical protein
VFRSLKGGKEIEKSLKDIMKDYVEKIEDNSIKKIIKSFIKDDDFNFMKSIESYLYKEKLDVNYIYAWSMIEMKKDSLLVMQMLKQMESRFFSDKIKKDPKSVSQ